MIRETILIEFLIIHFITNYLVKYLGYIHFKVVIKYKTKINQITAYLILVGYLGLTVVNVFHFHKLNLGNKTSAISVNNETRIDENNFYSCPIQLAYNLLNNSIVSSPFTVFLAIVHHEKLCIPNELPKIKKEFISHSSLRAPPLFS